MFEQPVFERCDTATHARTVSDWGSDWGTRTAAAQTNDRQQHPVVVVSCSRLLARLLARAVTRSGDLLATTATQRQHNDDNNVDESTNHATNR